MTTVIIAVIGRGKVVSVSVIVFVGIGVSSGGNPSELLQLVVRILGCPYCWGRVFHICKSEYCELVVFKNNNRRTLLSN